MTKYLFVFLLALGVVGCQQNQKQTEDILQSENFIKSSQTVSGIRIRITTESYSGVYLISETGEVGKSDDLTWKQACELLARALFRAQNQ